MISARPAPTGSPVRGRPGSRAPIGWFSEIRTHVATHVGIAWHPSRWTARGWAIAVVTVVYLALTVLVLVPDTFLQHADRWVVHQHFGGKHASWLPWVKFVTGFGQRWIITYILQVVFLWACLRARSVRPMVYFVTALILINGSVGVVKTIVGRLGPFHQNNVHAVFVLGGNIFPSGHVSNAVSMFGVLAMAVPRFRWPLAVLAIASSLGVSGGTLFMRMHWFSDVVAGWIAGLLVLLLLPTFVPWVDRFADQVVAWGTDVVHRHRRLHRVGHAVLAWGMRVVPADPDYWLTPRQRRRRRTHPDEYRVGRHRCATPDVEAPDIEASVADSEFASWPVSNDSASDDRPGRERQTTAP